MLVVLCTLLIAVVSVRAMNWLPQSLQFLSARTRNTLHYGLQWTLVCIAAGYAIVVGALLLKRWIGYVLEIAAS